GHIKQQSDGVVAGTLGITDHDGKPQPLGQQSQIMIETRAAGGEWELAGTPTISNEPPLLDVMVVADNSGSALDELPLIQDALHHFAHVILARAHDDAMGIVRVSTVAS